MALVGGGIWDKIYEKSFKRIEQMKTEYCHIETDHERWMRIMANREDGIVYFIEDTMTQEWLSKHISMRIWTRDPIRALTFKNIHKALGFCERNGIYGKGIKITEHEFVNSQPSNN